MTARIDCWLGADAPRRAGEVAIDGPAPAIRIHAAPGPAPAGLWGIELTVGYQLPMSFTASVKRLSCAFVLTLEEAEGRARGALRLAESGADPPAPNFAGRPLDPAARSSTIESAFACAVWVARVPELAGRPLIARVLLQSLVSNPLTLLAPVGEV